MRWAPATIGMAALVVSTVLFGAGFLLPGLKVATTTGNEDVAFEGCRPSLTPPERTVLMVIDAWKLGFLVDDASPMEFIKSSISSGSASLLHAHAQTPTVTMPRIKALTSGAVPSFSSVLLNFHSSESHEDSWLRAMKETGKRIVFYGDDTWLRLFPSFLDRRSEGVTSFYVNDYTEVDNIVTRHLEMELSRRKEEEAADVLILHYLGLDHIGHSLGGESPEIAKKLREMDGIVKRIVERLQSTFSSSLVMVLGDHGMTLAGGHGGASPDETTVPVVVFRSRGKTENHEVKAARSIEQLDIASSLSHLLGLRTPNVSLGISFLHMRGQDSIDPLFSSSSVAALRMDIERLRGIVMEERDKESLAECSLELSRLFTSDCRLREERGNGGWRDTVDRCYEVTRKVQSHLIRGHSHYDHRAMGTGILLSIGTVAFLCLQFYRTLISPSSSLHYRSIFTSLTLLLHFLSFFASSLVEEEHEFWYFFVSSSIFVEFWITLRKAKNEKMEMRTLFTPFVCLCLHRVCMAFTMGRRRRWTMDEDQLPTAILNDLVELSIPDLSIVLTRCPPLLFHLITATSLYILAPPVKNGSKISPSLLLALVLARNLDIISASTCSLLLWTTTTVSILETIVRKWRKDENGCVIPLETTVTVLLSSIVRREFVPLLACCRLLGGHMAEIGNNDGQLVSGAVAAAFFYQGTSNSLAGVDIAPGYTGLNEYNDVLVGVQILLNAYAPCIVLLVGWTSAKRSSQSVWTGKDLAFHLVMRRAVALLGCQLALIIFSSHLFVWTVFAPRFLFECSHCIVLAIGLVISQNVLGLR